MGVLKKIKGATLMETMVATALIVLIFMMASMLMNTIFSASLSANTQQLSAHLDQLEYTQKNGRLAIPYKEEWGEWRIAVYAEQRANTNYLVYESTHIKSKKQHKKYTTLHAQ